eukprot:403369801
MWDTSGQERYRSVTQAFYKGSHGIIFVYDVTNRDSFEKVQQISNHFFMNLARGNEVMAVIGNKSDKREQRQISFEEGMSFAKEIGCYFQEASALEGYSIQSVFHDLVLRCIQYKL